MMQESYGSLQAHIIRDLVRPYGPGPFFVVSDESGLCP